MHLSILHVKLFMILYYFITYLHQSVNTIINVILLLSLYLYKSWCNFKERNKHWSADWI